MVGRVLQLVSLHSGEEAGEALGGEREVAGSGVLGVTYADRAQELRDLDAVLAAGTTRYRRLADPS